MLVIGAMGRSWRTWHWPQMLVWAPGRCWRRWLATLQGALRTCMKLTRSGYTADAGLTETEEVNTMILRRIAQPLLAAIFVSGGIETLRNPKPRIQAAEPMLDKTVGQLKDRLPEQIPTDSESLVKLDAAVKLGAGIALGLGKLPRLAALLLAGSLVPTTAAAHPFWEYEDPQERAAQQIHFFKNLGLLGGLLLTVGGTHGKPSLGWRASRAVRTRLR